MPIYIYSHSESRQKTDHDINAMASAMALISLKRGGKPQAACMLHPTG